MPDSQFRTGVLDILTYFSSVSDPKDRYPKHISRNELSKHKHKLSAAARKVVHAIEADRQIYRTMSRADKESWRNHYFLSFSDLNVLANGIHSNIPAPSSLKAVEKTLAGQLHKVQRTLALKEKWEKELKQADTTRYNRGNGRGLRIFASATTGTSPQKLNKIYKEIRHTSANDRSILAFIAALSGESAGMLNIYLSRVKGHSSENTKAVLILAAVLLRLRHGNNQKTEEAPIDKVNRLYKELDSLRDNAESLLVLAAIIRCDDTTEDVYKMFQQLQRSESKDRINDQKAARLVLIAAFKNQTEHSELERLRKDFDNTYSKGWNHEQTVLTFAAAVSEKHSVKDVHEVFQKSTTLYNGSPAILTLASIWTSIPIDELDTIHRLLPLIGKNGRSLAVLGFALQKKNIQLTPEQLAVVLVLTESHGDGWHDDDD